MATSPSNQTRSYIRAESVVFLKTKEAFGGLSNMAGGFPLEVNDIRILTSEALYQACRFPHLPDVQEKILGEKSPMTAKMVGKPFRKDSRADWEQVKTKIMRWCLRVKLAQNWDKFSELLLETGNKPIVEESNKDSFWGAKPEGYSGLVGMNVLGRLLMELREAVKAQSKETLMKIEPLSIPNFLLMNKPIGEITVGSIKPVVEVAPAARAMPAQMSDLFAQPSLFDSPQVMEPVQSIYKKEEQKMKIADLKPYPKYRDSSLPWMTEIPEHWELIPNRGLIRRRKILVGSRHKDYKLLSLTKQGIIVRDISTGKGKFSSDMGTSQEVRSGDLVFCLFDVPETPRTVGLSSHDGMITGAYTVFESRKPESTKYFELFYKAMDDRKLLSPLYSGLRNTITSDRFLGTKSPLPPLDEQVSVVRFLNWANTRIDRTINAKRKIIALLNEQKQAIIHKAVTRGLDPNVKLKDSGVPWLGEIPEHWDVLRAKYLFREIDDRSVTGQETHLAMSQKLGLVPSEMVKSALRSESYAGGKLCKEGDIVLNRLKAHLGVFAIAKQFGVISPDYSVFRKRGEVVVDYFESLLKSSACRGELKIRAKGIVEGFWRLYTDDFYDIRLPVPPAIEQTRIMSMIAVNTASLNTTISRLESEIDFFGEYRTRLVADVVTGKLDVREAAAKLPEVVEPVETEPEDLFEPEIEEA